MNNSPWTIAARNGWHYSGDVNLDCGGTFLRVDESRYYADVIEFIDASNAGVDGRVWIEAATVPIDVAGKARIRSAFDCCGLTARGMVGMSRDAKAIEIALALYRYGFSDRDCCGDVIGAATDATLEFAEGLL